MNYAEPTREAKGSLRQSRWRRMLASGWLAPVLLALCVGGVSYAGYKLHGAFGQRATAGGAVAPAAANGATSAAGLNPVRLTRTLTAGGAGPEFLEVTLLPGRGMQVLQIMALIPGHGEVPLLVSPGLGEAAAELTETGQDAHGAMGMQMGGAFMAPWAGHLTGTPGSQPGTLETFWNGAKIVAPMDPADAATSVAGLLLNKTADSVKVTTVADGQSVEAVFNAHNFSPDWPSSVELTLDVVLTGKTLEISMTAKNTGNVPTPFGAGWHPIFAIPDGDRADAQLSLPSNTVSVDDADTGQPTGKTNWLTGTPRDFMRTVGTPLGSTDVDETYVNLTHGPADAAPVAELRVPSFNYGLQLLPLTANITRMHVTAPLGKNWVAIAPETNAGDPFGSQWGTVGRSGMAVVQPGATFEWKVRLQLTALTTPTPAGLVP
jgi:aldose 1-epimerase